MISGEADIGFMGAEATVYAYLEGTADPVVNFAQLTQRAGNFVVGREKDNSFTWEKLKNKEVLGGRKGGMPEMVFEYVLAQKGIEINQPADIIRDPYVFEFLGVPENKPMLESDLEKALVAQIEKFLLELGRGFMFVGTQQRVTLNNTHYYVDMVFYNKILRAYVLIELKTKKLTPEAAGQLNMYLNYYAAEVNDPDDNPPIGIILCTEKDSIAAEYALGGLSNNIFASRYVLYMPDKEQLIAQVEAVLKNWHEKKDNRHD